MQKSAVTTAFKQQHTCGLYDGHYDSICSVS